MEDNVIINVPNNVENMLLPDPSLLNYYKNLKNRTIWLETEIDESCLEIIKDIINFNIEDAGCPVEERKPIYIMVHSPGGNLSETNSIIDAIKASKTPVYSVNIGCAHSGACFISMACHKRFAMKNSTYLIHHGEGQFSGTFEQVVCQLNEYQRQIECLEGFIHENTKIPNDVFEERINTEWFVTAQEALEYGICDKIIDSLDDIM